MGNGDETSNPPKRDESDVYDRQIRLWGADAQAKMKDAKVLYVNITGVSTEVLKNLVLAGIRAAVLDNRPCSSVVSSPNVLLGDPPSKKSKTTVAQEMKVKIEELNPLLGDCQVISTEAADLSDEEVAPFSIVVASQVNLSTAIRLSKATTKSGGKFFLCDTFGLTGACCFDLGRNHKYRPEIGKKLGDPTPLKAYLTLEALLGTPLSSCVNRFHKTPPLPYVQYRCLLECREHGNEGSTDEEALNRVARALLDVDGTTKPLMTDEDLRQLQKVSKAELAPICSVLGGIIGNEVIKAISGKGEPANNTILFDGNTCKAFTFLVRPKE